MVGVYGILCLVNRKLYVGQSKNVFKRWDEHREQLRHNKHFSKYLQNAWNRYGPKMFCFFIIEKSTPNKVYQRELWWIKTLQTYKRSIGFNRHWKEVYPNGINRNHRLRNGRK